MRPLILALVLVGCGPTAERACEGSFLYVRAYEALTARAAPTNLGCARVEQGRPRNEANLSYPEVQRDLFFTAAEVDFDGDTTVTAMLDGFEQVEVHPDGFSRTVFEFGTRNGEIAPAEGADVGFRSSVVTPRGVEVVGRATGYVAEWDGEVVVRCSHCEVYIPYAPSSLTLQVQHGVVHVCAAPETGLDVELVDTTVHVEVEGVRRSARFDVTPQPLPSTVGELPGARLVGGGGLCSP